MHGCGLAYSSCNASRSAARRIVMLAGSIASLSSTCWLRTIMRSTWFFTPPQPRWHAARQHTPTPCQSCRALGTWDPTTASGKPRATSGVRSYRFLGGRSSAVSLCLLVSCLILRGGRHVDVLGLPHSHLVRSSATCSCLAATARSSQVCPAWWEPDVHARCLSLKHHGKLVAKAATSW